MQEISKHSFDINVAGKVGVNAAIVFQNICHWVDYNRKYRKNKHDGRYWTYNSTDAFKEQFPYFSFSQIRTAIKKLVEAGLVIEGCYNQNPYDRTKWYSVNSYYEVYKTGTCICQKSQMEVSEITNVICEKSQMIITDIKPNQKPDVNEEREEKEFSSTPSQVEKLKRELEEEKKKNALLVSESSAPEKEKSSAKKEKAPKETILANKERKVKEFKDYFFFALKTRENKPFWTNNNHLEGKKFVDHWTESKPNGRKLRWEMEKTFDIQKRMNTWERNAEKFNRKPASKQNEVDKYKLTTEENESIGNGGFY